MFIVLGFSRNGSRMACRSDLPPSPGSMAFIERWHMSHIEWRASALGKVTLQEICKPK